jgi:Vam6/Vps39-like protein vacuolar protein sorting-associated protein 39
MPTVRYLQKLGPEYLQHIFKYARWVFDTDVDMGFEVSQFAFPLN